MIKDIELKLNQMRKIIKFCAPKAEEIISYGMPAFRINGKTFVAFSAFKNHIGFFPMSGSFLDNFEKELKGYVRTKGGVQFLLNKPLPETLIKKIIKKRLKSIK